MNSEPRGRPATVPVGAAWHRFGAVSSKLVISAVLMYLLLRKADIHELEAVLRDASLAGLIATVVLALASLLVSSYKWQLLLRAQNTPVSLSKGFSFYRVGLFFNNLLPSNIGGDVIRIADVARHTGRLSESIASVVGERLLSALALVLTAACGLVLTGRFSMQFVLIVVLLAGTVGLMLILMREKWCCGPEPAVIFLRGSRFARGLPASASPWEFA